MHIKEIVLEGFKSYATRTVIKGWDPQFNAVTGLNGSGKSNILDAICFVLGIETLRHLRAASLQDLVYKRGQAGIQKASVSIVFDNSNKDNSPIGYAQFDQIVVTRQVVVGGKNKYLINGHTTQQHVISNLFQSVQLNVNNPHFLIMQGQITKVLNMKPKDTLAMVEEAAGTRMFEERKDKAVKTIAKKEKKLDEIQALLREEILPKLAKLRSERAAYLEFQQTALEMERAERKCISLEYAHASKVKAQGEHLVNEQAAQVAAIDAQIDLYEAEREALQAREAQIARSMSGSRFTQLQAAAGELQTEVNKAETQLGLKKRAIDEEKGAVEAAIRRRDELVASVAKAESGKAKASREVDRLRNVVQDKEREVASLQDRLAALTQAGTSGPDAATAIKKQLADERGMLASLEADRDSLVARIKAFDEDIARIEPEIAEGEKAAKARENEVERARANVQSIEARIAEMEATLNGVNPEQKVNELRAKRLEMQRSLGETDRRQQAHASAAHLIDFHFHDPRQGFDRSQVHGPVASLFDVPDEHKNKINALECGIGGRLQNVVVDSEVVASELLRHGNLSQRTTFIPLNKIRGQVISNDVMRRAHEAAPGKCELALNLIRFDAKYRPAMELVFGTTIVCQDAETAKKITYDPNIKATTVTWAGDTFNPSGVASGGSRPQSGDRLQYAVKYRSLSTEIAALESTLADITAQLGAADRTARDLRHLADQLQIAAQRLEQAQGRHDASQGAEELVQQLRQVQQSKADAEARVTDMRAREEAMRTRIAELVAEVKSGSAGKDVGVQKKHIEKKLNMARKEQAKAASAHTQAKAEVERAAAELDELRADVERSGVAIEESRAQLADLEKEAKATATHLAELKVAHGDVADELNKLRREQSSFDNDRARVAADIKRVVDALRKLEGERKEERARFTQIKREVDSAKDVVARLEGKHPWLTQQSQQAVPLDAEPGALDREQANLRSLRKRHEQLKRNVNVNVMEMIGVAEKREAELQHKLQTVLHDKTKIEATIAKLDEIKEDELRKTWAKVNDDFGKIFADLLPGGNTAKLKPVQDDRILSGLEIHVRLGRIWKDSLTELSGGQRSLVALSLVLALLQFKPAPMYILDEVDAALDLSHTQNIGQLIKTRFTGSQFIIVSLKEGMFSNAHVIFKTKFRDGTSMVDMVKGPHASSSGGRGQ
ncbi:RecF/RecN/SMC [Catenaria anguillulae PL171]|uniref:Structural maintenance of chromosomes protein n=1 Tax=Catenaria anguillulae PL171 TaxID=765915 RepID=A0A1Y2HJQ8_9FUNG|nr:RecF/RecN/SMC [Catenaria anguillulae PL171]